METQFPVNSLIFPVLEGSIRKWDLSTPMNSEWSGKFEPQTPGFKNNKFPVFSLLKKEFRKGMDDYPLSGKSLGNRWSVVEDLGNWRDEFAADCAHRHRIHITYCFLIYFNNHARYYPTFYPTKFFQWRWFIRPLKPHKIGQGDEGGVGSRQAGVLFRALSS